MQDDRFFVVSGGPGTGKTTVLNELQKMGYPVIEEVARRVIREQMEMDGEGLPWRNVELFNELMLSGSIDTYHEALLLSEPVIFFDRGILDTVGHVRLLNLPISAELDLAGKIYRYNKKVFLFPPWEEIYSTDNERKQTYQQCIESFDSCAATYSDYGYDIVIVPKIPIPDRIAFILEEVQ